MPYGWVGQVLRIDLSAGKVVKEPLNMQWARQFIGGRGLGTKYLYEEIDPRCDPLGPENKVIFATGPLTGTYAPTGGRYMVLCKSPLTDAIACSNSGGYWGPELKFAGYDMVILEGRAPRPVYIWIYNDQVEIRDASHVWGKTTAETEDILRGETDPQARVAGIGPAGENLCRNACVINDKSRAAGRSGVGAAMGAKNVKAIVVRGTGAVAVADPLRFSELVMESLQVVNQSPVTAHALRGLGTASTVGFANGVGILPTRNFQQGQFEAANDISGQAIAKSVLVRNKGCYSCPIGCARVTEIKGPARWQGKGEGPEYETIFGLGSDCGVGDLNAVLYANYLCNLYGLDTISAGGTIAAAMELAEKGYIPKEDLAELPFELKFGNPEAVIGCLEMMAYRRGRFGHLLAEGGYRLAEHYGHPELFMGVKKQDFAAYDPRGAKGMGLGYATSNRGACHLRGYSMSLEWFAPPNQRLDPFSIQGKAAAQKMLQDKAACEDSSGICTFVTFALTPDKVCALFNAATGENLTLEDWNLAGERIWNLERMFNLRAGLGRKDDTLPPRMLKEPLSGGMVQGQVVELEPMLEEYYRIRGWDEEGRPKQETLARLGLS
ncbi:MAG: aldehyde ferredoxin oxidoreductase family protein [Dehalococcoidia bacterium]|jgi:aldehyde:ferredoxin oxidoreductase|nr:aldehyde ferredoxin oxidoreductase family protein [Dehalococcoidia bacterium]